MIMKKKPIKIAFLSSRDPRDKAQWVGSLYYMHKSLQKHAGEVTLIGPYNPKIVLLFLITIMNMESISVFLRHILQKFDIVLVIAPESSRGNATVLALEMWRASFGGMRDFGLGSALATVLFLLILPVLLFNVRRFSFED